MTDNLKSALKNNTVEIPTEAEKSRQAIAAVCKKVSGNLNIKPADGKCKINLNKEVFLGEDFKEQTVPAQ